MQEVISRSDLVFWLTGYGCILASALGPATGCQPIIPRFRGPTADGTAKWVNIPYIYIYTHIYSRHLQYFYVYNYTFFVFTYIYILCINIYFYIYIYTYKNIITYIDSYRSASKTLSLGFQVRKKVVFFHGPFDGDMPVRGLKSCRGLSQFCLWKGFQIRFWYGRRSDHTD